jgi:hypothetical protein
MKYHYPKLSKLDFIFFRIGGPGLGNLLFPLYRAYEAKIKNNDEIIFPQFKQIKIGPILRNEKDKRLYNNIFVRREVKDYLLSVKYILNIYNIKKENDYENSEMERIKKNHEFIEYEGMRNFFHSLDLKIKNDFLEYLFLKINNINRLKNDINLINDNDVCIHIRNGDFLVSETANITNEMAVRNSDEWYIKVIKHIYDSNPNAEFIIFSDEKNISKKILNEISKYKIDDSNNALHALIKMSMYKNLITSRSTFSLWAAFLGGNNIYVNKNFDIHYYLPKNINTVNFV